MEGVSTSINIDLPMGISPNQLHVSKEKAYITELMPIITFTANIILLPSPCQPRLQFNGFTERPLATNRQFEF